MIQSVKISGFKNFRGKSVELTNLKRINIFVGINGSGKSSVLELLAGVSKLSQLNTIGLQDVLVRGQASRLHSLFEPETEISFTYTTAPDTYSLKIITQTGDRWQVEKAGKPVGSTGVVAIFRPGATPFNDADNDTTRRQERPFGGIGVFDRDKNIVLPDLDAANELLARVNPNQRQLRKMNLSSGQFTFEGEREIRPEFLAGGSRYIAGIIAAIREMRNNKPMLVIDDLGDELFPAVRKQLLPEINTMLEKLPTPQFSQMFATTHNIELVKSALDHPEYCSVYMFDYDGSLIEFNGSKQKNTTSSAGLQSAEAIPVIAKMLGISDLDLGFPELILLTEEETKKTFLTALLKNPALTGALKKFEVLVPFQAGDGNTTTAIHNLLDLSKYLFFSEVWSDRYVIFTDHNTVDYESDGTAKTGRPRQNALAIAQQKLGLGRRFLLTKNGRDYTPTIEETYPPQLWKDFRSQESITEETIEDWLNTQPTTADKGKAKNKLARFVGMQISSKAFVAAYPELWRILAHSPTNSEAAADSIDSDTIAADDMYEAAIRTVIEADKASTSLLQRKLRIGYGRAARLIEHMEQQKLIGAADGARPRTVLVSSWDEARQKTVD